MYDKKTSERPKQTIIVGAHLLFDLPMQVHEHEHELVCLYLKSITMEMKIYLCMFSIFRVFFFGYTLKPQS